MKTLKILLSLSFLILIIGAYSQSWLFFNSFNKVSCSTIIHNYDNNVTQCRELDDDGNTYIFDTYGTLTQFNDNVLPHYSNNSSGSYIVKYNCAGEVVWHKAIANTKNTKDRALYMTLKNNHLYITGTMHIENYSKTWRIDSLVKNFNIPYLYEYPWITGRSYNYIIKMDLNGNIEGLHRTNFESGELQLLSNRAEVNKLYLFNQ